MNRGAAVTGPAIGGQMSRQSVPDGTCVIIRKSSLYLKRISKMRNVRNYAQLCGFYNVPHEKITKSRVVPTPAMYVRIVLKYALCYNIISSARVSFFARQSEA